MDATDHPDPYESLALLQMLTHAHGQADAYFGTIGDAAALAADQVQDVRLEYLEKGPTVTPSDVLLELFLSVALQHVGGLAVAAVTRSVMTRVLASRAALLLVTGRTEVGDKVAAAYRLAKLERFVEVGVSADAVFRKGTPRVSGSDRLVSAADALIQQTLLRGGARTQLYSDAPFAIADLATKVVFNTARKVPGNPSRFTRLTSRDSLGVAVLDNAQLYVRRQVTANRVLFEDAKHIVLLGLLTRDDVLTLIKSLESFAVSLHDGQSLTQVKEHFKLFFEACIWARTLYPPPSLTGVPPVFDLGQRGRDLTEYLLARLVSPDVGVPFADLLQELPPHARRRPDEPSNQYYVLQSLLSYFRVLRQTADQLEHALPDDGRSRWNYPEPPPASGG